MNNSEREARVTTHNIHNSWLEVEILIHSTGLLSPPRLIRNFVTSSSPRISWNLIARLFSLTLSFDLSRTRLSLFSFLLFPALWEGVDLRHNLSPARRETCRRAAMTEGFVRVIHGF